MPHAHPGLAGLIRPNPAAALALALAMGLASPAFANGQHVATVKSVTGDIGIDREGADVKAAPGTRLYVADRIVSSAGASAGILFRDGTALTVGPSTDVQVRDYTFEPKRDRFNFFVYLAKGAAVYTSGLMGKLSPDAVKVATPTATVGIRGTRFIVEAD